MDPVVRSSKLVDPLNWSTSSTTQQIFFTGQAPKCQPSIPRMSRYRRAEASQQEQKCVSLVTIEKSF